MKHKAAEQIVKESSSVCLHPSMPTDSQHNCSPSPAEKITLLKELKRKQMFFETL